MHGKQNVKIQYAFLLRSVKKYEKGKKNYVRP